MAIVKKKKGNKTKGIKVITPVGRLSYPYLLAPDTGRPESDGKYKVDLFISREEMKGKGKPMVDAILKVGREYFKKKGYELEDFKNPIRDLRKVDKKKRKELPEGVSDGFMIRAKSEFAPVIVDANKDELSGDQLKALKGGDHARLIVVIFPYSQQGGGVTMGLNLVQYVKPGEAFGQGKRQLLEMIEEIEVEADDLDDVDDDEDQDTEETDDGDEDTEAEADEDESDSESEEDSEEEEESEDDGESDDGDSEDDSSEEDDDLTFDDEESDGDPEEDEDEKPVKKKKTKSAPPVKKKASNKRKGTKR